MEIVFGLILIYICYLYVMSISYKKLGYKEVSGLKFFQVHFNKGNKGEYNIYLALKKIKGKKKIFANVYIPKGDGTTTEIDLLLVHEKGIVVIESKNYSGLIYGNASDYKWTQVLNKSTKNRFYNPILQNKNHIKHLAYQLESYYKHEYFSLIVFGDNCELKKITNELSGVSVINRAKVKKLLNNKFTNQPVILSDTDFEFISSHMKPLTNVSDKIKADHVTNVENTINNSDDKIASHMSKIDNIINDDIKKSKGNNKVLGCIRVLVSKKILGLSIFLVLLIYSSMSVLSYVSSQDNKVEMHESNLEDSDEISAPLENNDILYLGMSKASIIALLGEADKSQADGTLKYKSSEIYLSNDNLTGWSNYYNQLDHAMIHPTSSKKIKIDISEDELLEILGSPTKILPSKPFEWHYNSSSIYFDENMIVTGWTNYYNQLDFAIIQPTSNKKIKIDISKDELLEILGSPTKILPSNPFEWHYNSSSIYFDENMIVTGWTNYYNQLDHAMMKKSTGTISIGATKEKVLEVLGSPSKLLPTTPDEWHYFSVKLTFDSNRLETIYDPYKSLIDYIID